MEPEITVDSLIKEGNSGISAASARDVGKLVGEELGKRQALYILAHASCKDIVLYNVCKVVGKTAMEAADLEKVSYSRVRQALYRVPQIVSFAKDHIRDEVSDSDPLEALCLDYRANNALHRSCLTTVGDVREALASGKKIRGFRKLRPIRYAFMEIK